MELNKLGTTKMTKEYPDLNVEHIDREPMTGIHVKRAKRCDPMG